MPRLTLHLILAYLWLAGSLVSSARAQERSSDQYLVLAVAVDVQSIVIRDPSGHSRLYGIGDLLADGQWRVIATSPDALELQAIERLHGNVVNLQLRAGDAFDPQTLSASIRREGEPLYSAERMIQRKPAISTSERN